MSPDYYLLDELLTDEARDVRDRVRAFVDSDVLPVINDYWDRAEFPWALVPKLAGLGVVGSTISGPGCPGLSRLAAGMVSLEISRGDGSVNTFLGVQSGRRQHLAGEHERELDDVGRTAPGQHLHRLGDLERVRAALPDWRLRVCRRLRSARLRRPARPTGEDCRPSH